MLFVPRTQRRDGEAVADACARFAKPADAVRGENLRFFPELRHRVAKMLRVLAYDSGGAALPELLRPGARARPLRSHYSLAR
jgi:hypothetical protein